MKTLAIVIILSFPVHLTYSQSAKSLWKRGDKKLATKDYRGAVTDYSNALNKDSTITDGFLITGKIKLDHLNNGKAAIEDFNRAIRLKPQDSQGYLARGNAYYSLRYVSYDPKNTEHALADFSKAIQLSAGWEAYYKRGCVYVSLSDCDKAIEDFSESIKLNPQHIESYFDRIDCKMRKDPDYYEILADYDKAIDIDKNNTRSYFGKGDIYFKLKKYEEAVASYNMGISLLKQDIYPYVHYDLGIIKTAMNDIQGAMECYGRSLKILPNFCEARMRRGELFVLQNKIKEALKEYNLAMQAETGCNRAEIYILIGKAYQQANDHPNAIINFNNGLGDPSKKHEALSGRAISRLRLKQKNQACADYREAQKLNSSLNLIELEDACK